MSKPDDEDEQDLPTLKKLLQEESLSRPSSASPPPRLTGQPVGSPDVDSPRPDAEGDEQSPRPGSRMSNDSEDVPMEAKHGLGSDLTDADKFTPQGGGLPRPGSGKARKGKGKSKRSSAAPRLESGAVDDESRAVARWRQPASPLCTAR